MQDICKNKYSDDFSLKLGVFMKGFLIKWAFHKKKLTRKSKTKIKFFRDLCNGKVEQDPSVPNFCSPFLSG